MQLAARALLAALLALPLLVPVTASAQSTFRCTGKDGKKYYSQSVPPACVGMPVEELNAQGLVVRRFDAQATAAERARKEADEEERKKREAVSKEEGRRNRALLATYTSEYDIDQARLRALQENELAMKDIERRIALLKQKQQELKKEMDFYEGKNKPPAKLEQDMNSAAFDIKTQQDLYAAKQRDVDVINARYAEDKKRYLELTKGAPAKK